MSLGEDARQEMYCNEIETNFLYSAKLWKTKSGELIPICEMTDDHLLNAYRLMKERDGIGLSELLFEEIEKRGLEPLSLRETVEESTYGIGYVVGMKNEK